MVSSDHKHLIAILKKKQQQQTHFEYKRVKQGAGACSGAKTRCRGCGVYTSGPVEGLDCVGSSWIKPLAQRRSRWRRPSHGNCRAGPADCAVVRCNAAHPRRSGCSSAGETIGRLRRANPSRRWAGFNEKEARPGAADKRWYARPSSYVNQ